MDSEYRDDGSSVTRSGRREVSPAGLFVLAVAIAAVFLAIANFGIVVEHTGNGGTGPYIFTVALTTVVAAVLLFWALPRFAASAERWALVLGILAVVLLVVFWSGLSFALGVGAIAFGIGRTGGGARAGVYLGAAAMILAAIACVLA
jgi:hypothetical protein